MLRLVVGIIAAFVLACTNADALPRPGASKILSRGNFCPAILASMKTRVAQAPCRQIGGTRSAPVCGGSCDYTLCSVLRDAQNRPYCGCG
jgi:hypothetical protein